MRKIILIALAVLFVAVPAAVAYQPGDRVKVDDQDATVLSTWTENGLERIVVKLDPAATPTPTATPTATATPTSTATPTATPSPTPTPTPPPGAFPDASNTGVPLGTTLTQYTGPFTINTAGTVIDGKNIPSCIGINAKNVVIRNSKIACSGGIVIKVNDDAAQNSLTIEDSEITCNRTNGTAISEANITGRRLNIHDCENGGDVNQNFDIRDSYVHDIYNGGGAHADGFQMACGHWVGSGSACGASGYAAGAKNVTFVHNTIFSVDPFGALGTSAIISNRGGDQNILIQGNLMGGGAYTLYCEQGSTGINYRVLDNAFTKRFSSQYGAFGISTDCSDETQSGNYDAETGQPVSLP